jgi:NADPH:quinone reductase-like Zn-dependent oxidoreductase
MNQPSARSGLQLRSTIKRSGELELSLVDTPVPEPAPDEVVIRVEAAPINPSDIGLLFGAADMSTATASGSADRPVLTAKVPDKLMRAMAGRLDQSMPVGNEGAGIVVEAGCVTAAQALLGRTVAAIGGAMYSQLRCVKVDQCLPLPAGTKAADGASCFVNPLTALGMVETMRMEGHKALVHTAAASNLGQMLNRICIADGIGLVNIVRKPEQEKLLRELGARYVCNAASPTFLDELTEALVATGATIAFDAIGGGKPRRADPVVHGSGGEPDREGIQPLRLGGPQAGLHLRRPRHGADRVRAQLRHGLGHGRLAAVPVPAEDRRGGRPEAARPRRGRAEDDVREPLRARDLARRGAAAGRVAIYNQRATGEKFLLAPNRGLS